MECQSTQNILPEIPWTEPGGYSPWVTKSQVQLRDYSPPQFLQIKHFRKESKQYKSGRVISKTIIKHQFLERENNV